jgi:hypothetical protein
VTDAFGRADIQTRFALDARKGHARHARFVVRENLDIPLDADLTALFATEVERNREVAERSTNKSDLGRLVRRWFKNPPVIDSAG